MRGAPVTAGALPARGENMGGVAAPEHSGPRGQARVLKELSPCMYRGPRVTPPGMAELGLKPRWPSSPSRASSTAHDDFPDHFFPFWQITPTVMIGTATIKYSVIT